MAAATSSKLQVNVQEPANPATANARAPSPERKPNTEAALPMSPEASPSKKRPELRPQTKTPKNTEKDKAGAAKDKDVHDTSKAATQPTTQNRGGPQGRGKGWDPKRDNRPLRPTDIRKDDKRDDRRDRRDERRPAREGWTGQKKDQRPWDKAEERGMPSDKPLAPVHPLHCTWMFWLSLPQGVAARNDRKTRWESNLKELGNNFNSVEHFWSYVHHMELPSRMEYNSSYYLFKSGIKPMWEHEDNIGGGKWLVQLKAPNHVDEVWQNIMLAIVGEAFDASCDAITGAVVTRRRAGDRVAVWLRKSEEEVITELGEKIKAAATDGLEAEVTCTFSIHNTEPPTPLATET